MPLREQAAAFLAGCGIHIINSRLANKLIQNGGPSCCAHPLNRTRDRKSSYRDVSPVLYMRAGISMFSIFLAPVLIGQTPGDPALLGMLRNEAPAPPLIGRTPRDSALLGMSQNGPPLPQYLRWPSHVTTSKQSAHLVDLQATYRSAPHLFQGPRCPLSRISAM